MTLTDQALVAVHLARSLADGESAGAAHLVAGLLGEPEGVAGRRVRRLTGGEPAVRLTEHPGLHAPGLPRLSHALVALPVTDVPAWTTDLLRAAIRVGGDDLDDLLSATGLDTTVAAALEEPPPPAEDEEDAGETFGRGSFTARGLDRAADEAVSRALAHSTSSRALVPRLMLDEVERSALANLPEVSIDLVVQRALDTRGDHVSLRDLATCMVSVALEALDLPNR
ncbi:hypothetical protein DVS28_a1558 [Euzebya pacifica]|uniref:Uncharacterized protein n=1 Tax=Euzebya pacifica TaxID=1608957 RepID=A0A346XVK4_9ACTN|nr:hypothetical protein [Euzebya pacifica]AXV06251.1 hypothetical protein DVS28_a1558 [Euzebya pacifica]